MHDAWMGRYRSLISELVRHGNLSIKNQYVKSSVGFNISLTAQQWQILEYLVTHIGQEENLLQIAEQLIIPQSSFSKCTKYLCECELIQKYHLTGNRKNTMLSITEKGLEVYSAHCMSLHKHVFELMFATLQGLEDESIDTITKAIAILNAQIAARH